MPDRDVLSELRDARTLINDGCNGKGTFLSGERCQACVRYIDHAILMLKEQEETIKELQNAYGYLQKQFFEAQDKLLKKQEKQKFFVDENGKITPLPVVVRCKDCKHGEKCNYVYLCGKSRGFGIAHEPDFFCADGENKEGQ